MDPKQEQAQPGQTIHQRLTEALVVEVNQHNNLRAERFLTALYEAGLSVVDTQSLRVPIGVSPQVQMFLNNLDGIREEIKDIGNHRKEVEGDKSLEELVTMRWFNHVDANYLDALKVIKALVENKATLELAVGTLQSRLDDNQTAFEQIKQQGLAIQAEADAYLVESERRTAEHEKNSQRELQELHERTKAREQKLLDELGLDKLPELVEKAEWLPEQEGQNGGIYRCLALDATGKRWEVVEAHYQTDRWESTANTKRLDVRYILAEVELPAYPPLPKK